MGQVREAWTDVGKNAVVRRAAVRKSDKFSHVLSHLGLEHAIVRLFVVCWLLCIRFTTHHDQLAAVLRCFVIILEFADLRG